MELLVFAVLGGMVRSLFGLYKAYITQGYVRIDWPRIIIEAVGASFFGTIGVFLLSSIGYVKPWGDGSLAVAFMSGLFGADMLNILAKRIGISRGLQVAVQRIPLCKSLNSRQQKALTYALAMGIRPADYARMNNTTELIACKELDSLVRKGLLRKQGKGNSVKYTA